MRRLSAVAFSFLLTTSVFASGLYELEKCPTKPSLELLHSAEQLLDKAVVETNEQAAAELVDSAHLFMCEAELSQQSCVKGEKLSEALNFSCSTRSLATNINDLHEIYMKQIKKGKRALR